MTTLTSNIEDSWTVKLESRLSQPPPSTLGGDLSASSKFDAAFDSLPLLTLVVRDSQDTVVYEITLPESGPSEWLKKLDDIRFQLEEANKNLDAELLVDSVMPDPVLIEMEEHIRRLDDEIKIAIKNRDEHKVKLEEKRRLARDALQAESDQKKRFVEARFRHQSMAIRRAAERRGVNLEQQPAVRMIEPPPPAERQNVVQQTPTTAPSVVQLPKLPSTAAAQQPKVAISISAPKPISASQPAKSQASRPPVVQQTKIQAATPQAPKPKGPLPVVTRTVAAKSPANSAVKKAVPVSYKVREPEALPVLPTSTPKRLRRNKEKNYSQDLPDSLFSDDDDKDTLYPGQRLDETLFFDFSNLLRNESSRLLGTASAFTELWKEHSFFHKSKALLTPCWISDKGDKAVVAVAALEIAIMRTVLPEAPLPTIGRMPAHLTSSTCGACSKIGTLEHLFNVNSKTIRVDSVCAARLTVVVDYLTHLRTTVCSLRDPAQKIENVIEQQWQNFRSCLQQAEDIVVK